METNINDLSFDLLGRYLQFLVIQTTICDGKCLYEMAKMCKEIVEKIEKFTLLKKT